MRGRLTGVGSLLLGYLFFIGYLQTTEEVKKLTISQLGQKIFSQDSYLGSHSPLYLGGPILLVW